MGAIHASRPARHLEGALSGLSCTSSVRTCVLPSQSRHSRLRPCIISDASEALRASRVKPSPACRGWVWLPTHSLTGTVQHFRCTSVSVSPIPRSGEFGSKKALQLPAPGYSRASPITGTRLSRSGRIGDPSSEPSGSGCARSGAGLAPPQF